MSLYIANTYADLILKNLKSLTDVPDETRVPGLRTLVEQILADRADEPTTSTPVEPE